MTYRIVKITMQMGSPRYAICRVSVHGNTDWMASEKSGQLKWVEDIKETDWFANAETAEPSLKALIEGIKQNTVVKIETIQEVEIEEGNVVQ